MAQKKGQKPSVPQPPCDKLPESSKLSGSCKKDAKITTKKGQKPLVSQPPTFNLFYAFPLPTNN